MAKRAISRREAMQSLSGAVAASLFGGFWNRAAAATAREGPAADSFIDTHFHLVNPRLPGVPEAIASPDEKAQLAPFDASVSTQRAQQLAKVVEAELKAAGVGHALCMPRHEVSDKDPLGIKEIETIAALVRGVKLHSVGLAHPERFDRDHLDLVEAALKQGQVKAFKIYLGYLHYGPDHAGYRPYYELSARYQTPIIFHTGDTYSSEAKLKYAHPRLIDEVAVDFRNTRFVAAHFGAPWIVDAAEVVYKNENVWADLSGILIGDAAGFAALAKAGVLGRTVTRIKEGIELTFSPEKFMFGSDWPLAPVAVYRDFVQQMFPQEHHAAVFRDTAKMVFKL